MLHQLSKNVKNSLTEHLGVHSGNLLSWRMLPFGKKAGRNTTRSLALSSESWKSTPRWLYSHSSTHLDNSLILYWAGRDVSQQHSTGSIKYIYHNGSSIVLAVQRWMAVTSGTVDSFGSYSDYHARLYSMRLSKDLEEVQLLWVIGHYARWNMSDNISVVVTLLRVSHFHSSTL